MLLEIPEVLNAEQLLLVREKLNAAGDAWVDGRATAGHQGTHVKRNLQINEHAPIAIELGDLILAQLERHPLFISATLPNHVYPPMFNLYQGGMAFGSHVDGAIRLIPGSRAKIRTDLSVTLFLSEPETYDGGELLIEDTYGVQSVKLAAGNMIVYPATSLHQVKPVTSGARLAAFFWVQSLIRDDAQRTLLFDLDSAIQRLNQAAADPQALIQLTGSYHNLLRMWTDI
ncbi:Fe2+-dependent dioxygenase [Glaciimonas immobilis]|uniref:PKHD-type hydroxylase n=1 Tax=Glaciimonas immobilis TaxID=728004 RepID=A0A840RTB4_9BURK|nr:Fe2+-dependent dioxygenase [Glaciimonas immobilis]KAF3999907.1 Fe2+-dependent dioxygenase [Glaciimonas immobilis]MBB5200402.1 PKHD-type hydroxylase [Glaciimonas immobilis]